MPSTSSLAPPRPMRRTPFATDYPSDDPNPPKSTVRLQTYTTIHPALDDRTCDSTRPPSSDSRKFSPCTRTWPTTTRTTNLRCRFRSPRRRIPHPHRPTPTSRSRSSSPGRRLRRSRASSSSLSVPAARVPGALRAPSLERAHRHDARERRPHRSRPRIASRRWSRAPSSSSSRHVPAARSGRAREASPRRSVASTKSAATRGETRRYTPRVFARACDVEGVVVWRRASSFGRRGRRRSVSFLFDTIVLDRHVKISYTMHCPYCDVLLIPFQRGYSKKVIEYGEVLVLRGG